jgi:hypothetical protein
MKKSKYSEAQMATALRQVEAGAQMAEVTRKLGLSELNKKQKGSSCVFYDIAFHIDDEKIVIVRAPCRRQIVL